MSLLKKIKNYLMRIIAKNLLPYLHETPYFYGQHPITLGKNVKLANTILNARSGKISIGNNVIFGHNCMVLTGIHDYTKLDQFRHTVVDACRDIDIGENTWIASGSIIIGPVKIGKNSVIAAGSIVTKNVEESTIVGGFQAREIRKIQKADLKEHNERI